MKFSDPFGRKERRRQIAYEAVRDAMIQAGIDTPEAAQEIIRKTKDRSMKFLGAGLAVFLLAIWLVPKAMIVTFFLAFVVVFGIVKSTISGTRLIQRYIDEELK